MQDDFFHLGHVSRIKGLKGEVDVFLDVDDPTKYKDIESVFLEIEGVPIPFLIEHSYPAKGLHVIFKLLNINSQEEATPYIGAKLLLPINQLPKLEGNQFYYHEVVGFEVIDKEKGLVGVLKNISDYANNTMLEIMQGDCEILIPLNYEFVKTVDRQSKQLFIEAPEGLIDLYLE